MKDLLAEYVPRVYRFALRLTRDPHEAEEITQETFLRAWRSRGSLRNPGATRAWLFRIAANVWRDLARRRKFPVESAGPLPQEAAGKERTPDRVAADEEEVRSLIRGLDALPPRQRQVLYLSAMEELSQARIGAVLGISIEAVKASLSLARQAMRKKFGNLDTNHRED